MSAIPKPPADMYESVFKTMSDEFQKSARKLQEALEEVEASLERNGKPTFGNNRTTPKKTP